MTLMTHTHLHIHMKGGELRLSHKEARRGRRPHGHHVMETMVMLSRGAVKTRATHAIYDPLNSLELIPSVIPRIT